MKDTMKGTIEILQKIIHSLAEENKGQNQQIELLSTQVKQLKDNLDTVNNRLKKHQETILTLASIK